MIDSVVDMYQWCELIDGGWEMWTIAESVTDANVLDLAVR